MKRLTAAAAMLAMIPHAEAKKPPRPVYEDVVADVAAMVSDQHAWGLVAKHNLQLLNVLWEDTGRWEGSSVGPNISDVTIEVEADGETHARYLMPVMRGDNFYDETGDVKLDKIYVPVGNHDGDDLKTITLEKLLAKPSRYLSLPKDGKIKGGSLLSDDDTHALVSAQHAFLPVPERGQAKFWPVIFNYQSYQDNPAVLAILVTRQGTSMTIVDNARDTVADGGSWGQRLYFNHDGKKAPLVAERLKDVQAKGKTTNGEDASSLGEDANLLMLIQVPLKVKEPVYLAEDEADYDSLSVGGGYGGGGKSASSKKSAGSRGGSDVDVAVIGHGEDEGEFTELDGLTIERDTRFPVRVTVQFYQATSNGVISEDDVDRMAAQIKQVYDKADYVGSLVVPKPSDKKRPTRWKGAGPAPKVIDWSMFPGLVEIWTRYRFI